MMSLDIQDLDGEIVDQEAARNYNLNSFSVSREELNEVTEEAGEGENENQDQDQED